MEWLGRGLSDKEIARALGISDQTARTHRARLLQKAGAGNVCALLFLCVQQGWLELPQHQACDA
ncbi:MULTISPECIES: LuxR C-terminal-related transcriptional regulator [Cupriavidus]|uniref:LuxR C-terminal-related transcriptional regulator n=1 Tax=Cupriavidus alkaliphilus TaxID=942866 RepID=UPI000B82F2F7